MFLNITCFVCIMLPVMYFFRGDFFHWRINWCALLWGRPCVLLLDFLSFLGFFVWGSHPLWHIHHCHPCSACVWTVILMRVYGCRKHDLTKYLLALWLSQSFSAPLPPWSLRLRFGSILKLYPLGWGSTTLRFDWLWFFYSVVCLWRREFSLTRGENHPHLGV